MQAKNVDMVNYQHDDTNDGSWITNSKNPFFWAN
jgi:hypothetical protein